MKVNLLKGLRALFSIIVILSAANTEAYFKDKETYYPIVLEDCMPGEISINSFLWSPNGNFIAVTYFNNTSICKIFNSYSGKLEHTIEAAEGISAISWVPDNNALALGFNSGDVEIRTAETDYQVVYKVACNEAVKLLRWNPNGKYLCVYAKNPTVAVVEDGFRRSFSDQSVIHIFDVTSIAQDAIGRLEVKQNITDMQWNQSGDLLAIAQNSDTGVMFTVDCSIRDSGSTIEDTVEIYHVDQQDVSNYKLVTSFESKDSICSIAWVPQDQFKLVLCVANFTHPIRIYDLMKIHNPDIIKDYELGNLNGEITCSADGSYLASSGLNRIKLYDLRSLSKIAQISIHDNTLNLCKQSSSTTSFVTCLNPDMMEYYAHLESLKLQQQQEMRNQFIAEKIAWSPNGPYLAVAIRDKTANALNCHALIILHAASLYFSYKKLLGRELTGKRQDIRY